MSNLMLWPILRTRRILQQRLQLREHGSSAIWSGSCGRRRRAGAAEVERALRLARRAMADGM